MTKPGCQSMLCAALATILIALAGSAPAQTPNKAQIRAAYIPVVTWLPAMVALDTGIFDRHGLEVTLSPIQNPGLLPGTLGKNSIWSQLRRPI